MKKRDLWRRKIYVMFNGMKVDSNQGSGLLYKDNPNFTSVSLPQKMLLLLYLMSKVNYR